ncbi:tRNA 2-thiouridine(34) synthase MnmA [Candidatus Endowatersipora endosymbiont of Watersipora subatra]|uniref:tRNA 2-thiouridine(34) synthase MnmA n=1 Tax=Candidatus Endowatersipora endosymbiont of Watersipora subatra TaxID=3077946 RepID=UPI003C7CF7B2
MLNSLGFPKSPIDTRVVVAMSGGVDSSVVASLLKKEGYDIVGITLQLYDQNFNIRRKDACCAGRDIYDARRVSEQMGFPHYVLDYETIFRKSVIDPFANAYIEGKTPVPCITCNQNVKFSDLLSAARDLGADCLATGHYIVSREGKEGHQNLYRSYDRDKDQSYFLFSISQEKLNYLRFPLGKISKSETRAIAKEIGLKVSEKSESQDICFVPKGHYSDFIKKLKPEATIPGDIIHLDGRRVGRHQGIIHYTIGQRRGVGVAMGYPLYVIKLDVTSSTVYVGPRSALATDRILLDDVNWLGDQPLEEIESSGMDIAVRVRSTQLPRSARLVVEKKKVEIILSQSEEGVSPGQACVFYEDTGDQSRVLGGGWIKTTDSVNDMNV